jgi:hypothetical protein
MHKVPSSLALAIAFVALAGSARADDATARARDAYDRGQKAYAQKDWEAAARAFAEADAIAPAPASLEAALEASMRADDVTLGAELLSRSEGRPSDKRLDDTLAAARRRFSGRVGKILIDCKGARRCLASIDGVGAEGTKPIYAKAGAHAVVVERGDERFEKLVEVPADAVTYVGGPESKAVSKPEPLAPPPAKEHGISPAWFYVGLGATTIAGGFTVVSAIDLQNKHDSFVSSRCLNGAPGRPASDCGAQGEAGNNAQTRTNILLGATAIVGVATALFGVFALSSSPPTQPSAKLGIGPGVASLEITTP